MTFVKSHVVLRHPILSASKSVQIPAVLNSTIFDMVAKFRETIPTVKIRFVIRDLENFQIFTEITILPFFRKLEFSWVLQIGDLSVIFLDNFLPSDFFFVFIQRSRFRPPFLKNPTAMFVIQRFILNLKFDLTIWNDF